MISRFEPSRLATPFLILVAIGAVSYWLNPEPWRHLTLASKLLFAVSALAVGAMLLLMRSRIYLRIDERGLEIKYAVGAPRFYPWADIESARIVRVRFLLIPMAASVHLRLRPEAQSANPARRTVAAVTGANASIPGFFELSPDDIVEKIEFFKRRL